MTLSRLSLMMTVSLIFLTLVITMKTKYEFKVQMSKAIVDNPNTVRTIKSHSRIHCAISCKDKCCSASYCHRHRTCSLSTDCVPLTKESKIAVFIKRKEVCKTIQGPDVATTGPIDCSEFPENYPCGVYTIYPPGIASGIRVYCESQGGQRWTVIQRRQDGSVEFYRDWDTYKYGFGCVNGEHWLGNEHIHKLTSHSQYKLRVYIEDFHGLYRTAEYDTFKVGDEQSYYKLSVAGYSGDAGDAMTYHSGMEFSATDVDNDLRSWMNCVNEKNGGWWHNDCTEANLNGKFGSQLTEPGDGGIFWYKWGYYKTLRRTVMMITREN